jgi:hypothetical protein
MSNKIPPSPVGFLVSQDLLDALDRAFPPRHLDPRSPHVDFIVHAAQRDVVEYLRTELQKLDSADPMANPILKKR